MANCHGATLHLQQISKPLAPWSTSKYHGAAFFRPHAQSPSSNVTCNINRSIRVREKESCCCCCITTSSSLEIPGRSAPRGCSYSADTDPEKTSSHHHRQTSGSASGLPETDNSVHLAWDIRLLCVHRTIHDLPKTAFRLTS